MLEHDATSLLLLSPPVTPLTRKRADASDPTAANAKSTETLINTWRGWCCLLVTTLSVVLVLQRPKIFLFWRPAGARVTWEETGPPGTLLAVFFVFYLCADTLIAFLMRAHFKRSLGPLYVHHAIVIVGMACYMYPSPPRALFLYLWGEALTACRVLPPGPRWRARSVVFAARRVLWSFLLVRDLYIFDVLRRRKGAAGALVPPILSVTLLCLDSMWWHEHARAALRAAAAPADVHGGSGGSGGGGGGGSGGGGGGGEQSMGLLEPSSQLLGGAGELVQLAGVQAQQDANELIVRISQAAEDGRLRLDRGLDGRVDFGGLATPPAVPLVAGWLQGSPGKRGAMLERV